MSDLYFEHVAGIGNLYLEHVFYAFEQEPILFLCTDSKDSLYFCLCSEIRCEQKWIVMETTCAVLSALLAQEVDIASAFLTSKTLTVITLDLQGNEKSHIVKTSEVDRLDLPRPGTFLRCDKEAAQRCLRRRETAPPEQAASQALVFHGSALLDKIVYKTVIQASLGTLPSGASRQPPAFSTDAQADFARLGTDTQSVTVEYAYSVRKREDYAEPPADSMDVDKQASRILQAA